MKKATLYILGDVQRAGYRTKVVSIAKAFDIKGNVQNLPDGRVKIIAEGEESNLEQFIQAVNIKNTLIKVRDIEKQYSDSSGEYQSFYKLVSSQPYNVVNYIMYVLHNQLEGIENEEIHRDAY